MNREDITKIILDYLGDRVRRYELTKSQCIFYLSYDLALEVVKYLYKYHRKAYYMLSGWNKGKKFDDKIMAYYKDRDSLKPDYHYIYY